LKHHFFFVRQISGKQYWRLYVFFIHVKTLRSQGWQIMRKFIPSIQVTDFIFDFKSNFSEF